MYSVWTFPLGESSQGVKLTTHLHLVLRSKLHGAVPPLPYYASMAWCLVKKKQRGNFTFTFLAYTGMLNEVSSKLNRRHIL
jgi:hypothetical protein